MHLAADRSLFRAALFVMLAATAAARAEDTRFLRFELVGVCRDIGAPLFVVNGNDGTEPKEIKRIDDSLTWTATWPTPIPAEGSVASARLGGSRTNSVRSKAVRIKGRPTEAFFELTCGKNAAWNVTIETDPHRSFGYLRYLKRLSEADVDSFEHEDHAFGTGKTFDVQLWDETINLRLDRSLFIHLNSIPIFRKPKEGMSAQQTLDRNDVVEAVARSLFGTAFSSADRNAIRTKKTIRELDGLTLTRWVK